MVQRIVVKEGLSHDLADHLLADMRTVLQFFASQPGYISKQSGQQFAHL